MSATVWCLTMPWFKFLNIALRSWQAKHWQGEGKIEKYSIRANPHLLPITGRKTLFPGGGATLVAVFVGVEVPVAVALGVDVRVWVGVGVIGLTTVIVVTFVLGMPRKVMLSWYW